MQSFQNNLLNRPDTFFGVCEALGEDLHIPANLLRVALAGLLFWSPVAALGAYAAGAVLVAFTRWLYPNPRIADAEVVDIVAGQAERAPVQAQEQARAEPVALAA